VKHDQDLSAFLDRDVYPALFARLDAAFPDYGFKRSGKNWVATNDQACATLPGAPEAKRVYCYENRAHCLVVQGGDAVRFLDLANDGVKPIGPEFVTAARKLADLAGVAFPERELSPEQAKAQAERYAQQSLLETAIRICQEEINAKGLEYDTEADKAESYLHSRGLPEHTWRADWAEREESGSENHLGIGLYPNPKKLEAALLKAGHDKSAVREFVESNKYLAGYVVFPWNDATGRPLTLYGRLPAHDAPKEKKNRGMRGNATKTVPLYFDRARRAGDKDLVLVEGLFDAALPQGQGMTNVIACNGRELTADQAAELARYGVKSVTICLDSDDAGRKGTLESIKRLTAVGIESYVAPALPDGMDPADFIQKAGGVVDDWQKHIKKAEHSFRYKAQTLVDEHRRGDDWTDKAKRDCIDAAFAFDEAVTDPARATDLEGFFWPSICEATGITKDAVDTRRTAAREKAAAEHERQQRLKLIDAYKDKLDAGDLDGANALWEEGEKKLSKARQSRKKMPALSMAERMAQIDDKLAQYRGVNHLGMPTRTLPQFDKYLSGLRGLVVLAAAPGVGKTTLTYQIGTDIITNDDRAAFLFVSLEMNEDEMDIGALSYMSGLDANYIYLGSQRFGDTPTYKDAHEYFTPDEWEKYTEAKQILTDLSPRLRLRTKEHLGDVTVETLVDEIEDLKTSSGADRVFVAVDYLNVWPTPDGADFISDIDAEKWRVEQMKALKFAVGDAGAVMVISEARKPSEKGTWGGELSDIMGSARTGYAPDIGLLLTELSDTELSAKLGKEEKPNPDEGQKLRAEHEANDFAYQSLYIAKARRPSRRGRIFLKHHFRTATYTECNPAELSGNDE